MAYASSQRPPVLGASAEILPQSSIARQAGDGGVEIAKSTTRGLVGDLELGRPNCIQHESSRSWQLQYA